MAIIRKQLMSDSDCSVLEGLAVLQILNQASELKQSSSGTKSHGVMRFKTISMTGIGNPACVSLCHQSKWQMLAMLIRAILDI